MVKKSIDIPERLVELIKKTGKENGRMFSQEVRFTLTKIYTGASKKITA